ncbi:MAG: transposase [Deltaproteobacteria bacterium]|jgi:hypothetical protein|nr:transposase [Deltaproteobacteria bacterium]
MIIVHLTRVTEIRTLGLIDAPATQLEFKRAFGSEEVCLDYLIQVGWPDGLVCPQCPVISPPVSSIKASGIARLNHLTVEVSVIAIAIEPPSRFTTSTPARQPLSPIRRLAYGQLARLLSLPKPTPRWRGLPWVPGLITTSPSALTPL